MGYHSDNPGLIREKKSRSRMINYYYYYYLKSIVTLNIAIMVSVSVSVRVHYSVWVITTAVDRQTDRRNLQMRWRCQFLSFLLSLVERTPKSVWNSGSSSINPLLNFYPCIYVCVCVFLTKCESFKNPPPQHSTVSCNTMLIVVALHVRTVRPCAALCLSCIKA